MKGFQLNVFQLFQQFLLILMIVLFDNQYAGISEIPYIFLK